MDINIIEALQNNNNVVIFTKTIDDKLRIIMKVSKFIKNKLDEYMKKIKAENDYKNIYFEGLKTLLKNYNKHISEFINLSNAAQRRTTTGRTKYNEDNIFNFIEQLRTIKQLIKILIASDTINDDILNELYIMFQRY